MWCSIRFPKAGRDCWLSKDRNDNPKLVGDITKALVWGQEDAAALVRAFRRRGLVCLYVPNENGKTD